MTSMPAPREVEIARVLDFWFRELTPADWFGEGETLDPLVTARFGVLHERAVAGDLDDWARTAHGRLALVLVLDQFSRHIHRGTAQAFAADAKAQALALEAIALGIDGQLALSQRHFLYLPLMHAEDPDLQRESVAAFEGLRDFVEEVLAFARSHEADIARFGRFPYRNAALGRTTTEDEAARLAERQGP